jgi:hypothetical protein
MFKSRAKGLRNLKRFGEMCVETTKNNVQGKFSDKGTVCVFVGYAVNYADDVYRLLNPKIKSIIKSRNVVCLDKTMEPGSNQRMIQVLVMIQTMK